MGLSDLRAQALERDGGCVWPSHFHEGPLELMHLTHRGIGGDDSVNTLSQVAIGCRHHHDILDGRSVTGRKAAVADLLAAYLGRERMSRSPHTRRGLRGANDREIDA